MSAGLPPVPGFLAHLGLLWRLRLQIGLNQGAARGRALAIAAFAASCVPAPLLFAATLRVMRWPGIVASELWQDFLLRLLAFVTAAAWTLWPVLSAGVDDHSEVSRYGTLPISPLRLLVASSLAGLVEPRALVIFAPLAGATLGFVQARPGVPVWLAAASLGLFALLSAAAARVALHVVLEVLRSRRSAAAIGGGLALFLALAALLPPIDTSWLLELGRRASASAVPDMLVERSVLGLGRFPTGWFARALSDWAHGRPLAALTQLTWLAQGVLVLATVAWGLLVDFHRRSARGGAGGGGGRSGNPFARTRTLFWTLVVREALDLWRNPRARLLVAVPFVFAILIRVASGRDLVVFFQGASADAWLLGALSVYGAVVLGAGFTQNAFAYDGHGFAVFLASPVPLRSLLMAKNAVHAAASVGLAAAVVVFYRLYFGHGAPADLACALLGVLVLVPWLLATGNFMSVLWPVRYHANLKRRDRPPLFVSLVGIGAAAVGVAPLWLALRRGAGPEGPGGTALAVLGVSAGIAWGLYALALPLAAAALERRRELVLRAVSRD